MKPWLLPILSIALISASLTNAREIMHTVAPGETLGDIAQRYYAQAHRSALLVDYNRLKSEKIRVGQKLRIPVVDRHEVRVGETWSALAARYWGDAKLHRDLARYTTGKSDSALRIGQRLDIPVFVPYRLKRGETLAAVARSFYGDPDRAASLARINHIENPRRLQVGASLRIPLGDLGLAPAVPADHPTRTAETPPVSAPAPERAAPAPSFKSELQHAINAYLDGRYQTARDQLEKIRADVLARGSRPAKTRLLRQLVFLYVAFDSDKKACQSYRALQAIDPELEWDPEAVSPKILGVISSCEGG